VRLAGDPQAAYLGPQGWGLDGRVSQEAAGQVDLETRRLVEEALSQASGLLAGHRAALDWLAERLCEYETVNGSEVAAMLASASMADASMAEDGMAEDGNILHDGSLAPDGSPWQDASLWRVRQEKATAVQEIGLAPKGSPVIGKTASGNGHQPTRP